MNINILSEFYSPSTGATAQLIADLSDSLHQRGHSVRVITSTPGLDKSTVSVIRLPSPSTLNHNILTKSFNGLFFLTRAFFWMYFHVRPHEITLVVSNPPFIGCLSLLLKLLKGQQYVFLLQDLFPRSATLSGILPSSGPLPAFWRWLIQLVCTHSQTNIVLSHSMLARATNEYPSSSGWHVIHNWAVETALPLPKRSNHLLQSWNLDPSHLIVQYSGNFGRLHDLLTILEAARILRGKPITFLFVGTGPKESQIKAYKSAFHLDNLILKPAVPRSQLPMSLAIADISVISLACGAHDTVAPSKLQGIVASNIPILAICSSDSELCITVNTNTLGCSFEPGDSVEIASYLDILHQNPPLLQQYRNNLLKISNSRFLREDATSKYEALLCSQ